MTPQMRRFSDEAFTIHDFLSRETCEEYIRLSEELGYSPAPLSTLDGPRMTPDVRNNDRVMLDDPRLADELWDRLRLFVPQRLKAPDQEPGRATRRFCSPIGLNERLRFYRYDPGQRFDWHFDGYHARDNGERSRLTFLVYLNDDFKGGETDLDLYRGPVRVQPIRGSALVFIHHVLHQGAPVVSGRKYVLRTDVMYSLTRA
ncbi:MAG: 2OG-Fe(II) oxygenase [Planctomycetales bacterium]